MIDVSIRGAVNPITDFQVVAESDASQVSPAVREVNELPAELPGVAGPNGGVALPRSTMPLTTEAVGKAMVNLDSVGNSDDWTADIYKFMKAFIETQQIMRQANRQARHAEREAQAVSIEKAAEAERQAADLRMAAGIVQGATQIAAGVAQIGFSAASGRAMKGSTAPMDAASTKASNLMSLGQATGSAINGVGGIASAIITHDADLRSIEAKRQEASGERHRTQADELTEMMRDSLDAIRDARQALQEILLGKGAASLQSV